MPPAETLAYEAWRSDDELRRTLEANPRAGADQDLPEGVRFVRSVATAIDRRSKAVPSESDGHAVFLLQGTPPETLTTTTHYAIDEGGMRLLDGAWFVNETARSGSRIDAPEDWDQIFEHVIGEWGLGGVEAVTIHATPAGQVLSYYPGGLSDDSTKATVLLEEEVTLGKILGIADRIHKQTLITPNMHSGGVQLWSKPEKFWVETSAEVRIQSYVRCGLSAVLWNCDIEPEHVTGPAGRLDLEIIKRSTRKTVAVLELKVLRSYGARGGAQSDAHNARWAEKGVLQARAYCNERHGEYAVLCCYDMRINSADGACMRAAERKAARLAVVVRRWKLYPTNDAYRDAQEKAV